MAYSVTDANHFSFSKFADISGKQNYDPSLEYDCLVTRGCRNTNSSLFNKGFLSQYSRTSYENDFNMYAEFLFINREYLQSLSRKYPLINLKYQAVKKFYADLGVVID